MTTAQIESHDCRMDRGGTRGFRENLRAEAVHQLSDEQWDGHDRTFLVISLKKSGPRS